MDTWQQVLNYVEKKVNQQSYNTWFKPTQLIRHDGRALYVRVPNSYFQDWLNEHIDVVLEAAHAAGLGDINVVYIIERPPLERTEAPSQGQLDFESIENTLNPKYTFDTFVVGSSNQFAHAAAQAVADECHLQRAERGLDRGQRVDEDATALQRVHPADEREAPGHV